MIDLRDAKRQARKNKRDDYVPRRERLSHQEAKLMHRYTTDPTFRWAVLDYGDQAADWTSLGSAYIASIGKRNSGSYGSRIHTISVFLRKYVAVHDLWDPMTILVGQHESTLPPLQGPKGDAPFRSSVGGISACNRLLDFLEWVLAHDQQNRFGDHDDGYFSLFPECRVPFEKRDYVGIPKHGESGYEVLPWKYICELKEKVAPGLHFSDWRWAQELTPKHGGTQSGDWFEVTDERVKRMVDLCQGDAGYDPDLVLRRRKAPVYLASGHNKKCWDKTANRSVQVTRDIIEAWSPVRAMIILTKLELCVRTFQTRVLDSGEADQQRVELVDDLKHGKAYPTFVWTKNRQRDRLTRDLTRVQLSRIGTGRGVFRPFTTQLSARTLTGLFFNTNKTGDIGKDPTCRGYFVPWENQTIIRWLIKLRNWQENYNPITRPALWTECTARHLGSQMAPALAAAMPPTCFLFRDASARNVPTTGASPLRWQPNDYTLPVTKQSVGKLWGRLLVDFQNDLERRGETVGGQPIVLIRRVHANSGTVSVRHPLHSLRVSLLTALAFEGKVPITILMKLAGHAHLLMTLFYTKPGEVLTHEEMERAIRRLNEEKDESYCRWLAQRRFDDLTKTMVMLDQDSIRSVLPEDPIHRTPYSWARVNDGWCMAGGNTAPQFIAGRPTPGCYNGGPPVKGDGAKSANLHHAITPRRCLEGHCRWLITGPAFLDEIRAKFASKAFSLHSLENLRSETEARLESLKDARYDASRAAQPFDEAEIRRLSTLLARQEADAALATVQLGNLLHVAQRCAEVAGARQGKAVKQQLVALGTKADIKIGIEEATELVAVNGICLDAEIYPELEGEATAAIYRRSQLLDKLLAREPKALALLTFDRDLQLEIGNRFVEQMANAQRTEIERAQRSCSVDSRALINVALTIAERSVDSGLRLPVHLRAAVDAVKLEIEARGQRPALQ